MEGERTPCGVRRPRAAYWQPEGCQYAGRSPAYSASELKRACCSVSNTPFLNTPVSFGHYSSILVTFSAELSRCEWRKSAVGDRDEVPIPVPLRESSIPLSLGICLRRGRGRAGGSGPCPPSSRNRCWKMDCEGIHQHCLLKLGVVRI